jgi:hypothetical protein
MNKMKTLLLLFTEITVCAVPTFSTSESLNTTNFPTIACCGVSEKQVSEVKLNVYASRYVSHDVIDLAAKRQVRLNEVYKLANYIQQLSGLDGYEYIHDTLGISSMNLQNFHTLAKSFEVVDLDRKCYILTELMRWLESAENEEIWENSQQKHKLFSKLLQCYPSLFLNTVNILPNMQ